MADLATALGSPQLLKRRLFYSAAVLLAGALGVLLVWQLVTRLAAGDLWTRLYHSESRGLLIFAVLTSIMAAGLLLFAVSRIVALLRTARALQLATDRLRLAMESGKSVGWDWDVQNGRDTWFGDLETMFGIPSSTYTGCVEDFRRRIHPEDRNRVWNAVNEAMKNHTPYSAEFRVRRTDGAVRWIAAKGEFYFLPTGKPKRMLGMAIDITELRRAQEALRESEERLRMAAQAGKMFAYSWDAASDVIERSGESAGILGFDETKLLTGQQAVARIHADDRERIKAAIAALTPAKPSLEVTYRMIRPDATMIWVERNSRAYFDDHGTLQRIVGMVADITDRKLAEEALASVNRRLIEVQEAERARIARDLHDDIGQRLSLSAIKLEELRQLPRDSAEKFDASISEIQAQLSEVSSSVHTLSHELHSSTLEHVGLVAAIRSCCRDLSEQRKAEIHFTHEGIPQSVPQEISLCLFRVLQEALHNALKHSGVWQFGVELRGTSDAIQLIISDSGVGFDCKTAWRGQGLGLTSMRERLKLVQGELFIDSQFKRGTTIRARVPFSPISNPRHARV